MEIISLLAQIPLVGIFVYFVIQSNKTHQESIKANHEEWRMWFTSQKEEDRHWVGEQNKIWREWIGERDDAHVAAMERATQYRRDKDRELTETLKHLDTLIGRLIELEARAK